MKRLVYQVDAFTTERFRGNPAGVVINASGLTEQEMLMLARELNNSETAFYFPPENETYDGTLRYFTPTVEVPVCGHATIGALYALVCEGVLQKPLLHIKTGAGLLPIQVIRDGKIRIGMTQGRIVISDPLPQDTEQAILQALGLQAEDRDPRCPLKIASTGHSKVMIGIHSKARLNALAPQMSELSRISQQIGCNGYFVFTFDAQEEGVQVAGRMFAPAIGIAEDPVTGNANGPLGAYLVQAGFAPAGSHHWHFRATQGEQIGRKGYMDVEVTIEEGHARRVAIYGHAVTAFKTDIEL